VIVSYVELLEIDPESQKPQERGRILGQVHSVAQEALTLANDLLSLSGESTAKGERSWSLVNVYRLVRETVEDEQAIAQHKGSRIEFSSFEGSWLCRGELNALKRVLRNLLSNAIKYSPQNSLIRVELRGGDSYRKRPLKLSVSDEGPGIHPEDRDKLFTPYFVTRNRATGGEQSTGLGLSIANEIVKRHGGRIGFENLDPRGARFTVELPDCSESARNADPPAISNRSTSPKE
jgi:signal transduction histidine kinase